MFIFGDKITATKSYYRKWMKKKEDCIRTIPYRRWEKFDSQIVGIYLGTRMIKNGWIENDDYGRIFIADQHIKVALVSPGPNLNPVYVPLDNMKLS